MEALLLATRRIVLSGGIDDLRRLFKKAISEAGFIIIEDEQRGEGIWILGVNRKRTSLMVSTLMSFLTGYIPRKRLALELNAQVDEVGLTATIRCFPYMDNMDMEAAPETQGEVKRCEDLVSRISDRIIEQMRYDS